LSLDKHTLKQETFAYDISPIYPLGYKLQAEEKKKKGDSISIQKNDVNGWYVMLDVNTLIYAAGACTLIAGILHLSLASNFIGMNVPVGVFFLVAGIVQIFWTLPTVRSWGKIWNYIGIGGTIILIIIWTITRYPDNPITGRGLPVNSIGVTVEVFQIAFIILCALMIARDRRTIGVNKKQ